MLSVPWKVGSGVGTTVSGPVTRTTRETGVVPTLSVPFPTIRYAVELAAARCSVNFQWIVANGLVTVAVPEPPVAVNAMVPVSSHWTTIGSMAGPMAQLVEWKSSPTVEGGSVAIALNCTMY
jgi:hypothetical protein